jgi:hypothetical protein
LFTVGDPSRPLQALLDHQADVAALAAGDFEELVADGAINPNLFKVRFAVSHSAAMIHFP